MHRAPTGASERFGKPVAGSLPTIIRCYAAAVTRQINKLCNSPGHKIWQRNYFEHVIRNDKSYDKIRQYIIENPLYWAQDDENPDRPIINKK
jgi:putative transposase